MDIVPLAVRVGSYRRVGIRVLIVIWLAVLCCCAPALLEAAPAFKASRLAEMEAAITNAMAEKQLPGAVFHLERLGLRYQRALGKRALVPEPERMTEDTIFDAASLTKVVATTPAIMLLVQRGEVGLDESLRRYLPEFKDEQVRVRHLLTHTSGLRAGIPSQPEWTGYSNAIRLACQETPINVPGTFFRYSDINFILLGEVVQRVSRRRLEDFVKTELFLPLGMQDTMYLPPTNLWRRIAPTEQTGRGMLRGVVHDPTSRRMGGVAGHAGVFTTASDLARYARMLLNGGELDGVRLFEPGTVRLMTTPQGPEAVLSRRGLGWDIDSPYSRPRGSIFPRGSFGHTGWTGAALWVDPFSRTFWILLSNRVHPDGRGSVLNLYYTLGTLAAQAVDGFDFSQVQGALPFRTNFIVASASDAPQINAANGGGSRKVPSDFPGVRNGIDVLVRDNFAPLRSKRLGLVTNHTGQDRGRNATIDLLFQAPDVQLKILFSPEHGIRGAQDEAVGDSVDERTGLPVRSLYPRLPARKKEQSERDYNALVARLRAPPPDLLTNLDALVFDIQDIGCRFYTYIATMGLCLEAAARAGVEFIVLDRVNPIGGRTAEGPIYQGDPVFVAWHDIPLRHGMTVGELARMFNAERKLNARLTVVRLEGWKREMWFDATGQPWRHPSPNMRSLNAATLYPGVGLQESALSVGRGTDTPFELVGAPYIDELRLAVELNGLMLQGIRFVPLRFTPTYSTFKEQECGGVAMVITDREALRPVDVGLAVALVLRRLYPREYALEKIQSLLRDDATLQAIKTNAPLAVIKQAWAHGLEEFNQRRQQYLLY